MREEGRKEGRKEGRSGVGGMEGGSTQKEVREGEGGIIAILFKESFQ